MYTAIVHDDGSFELGLHVPPATLSREEARRSLRLFDEALEPLRRRTREGPRVPDRPRRPARPPLAASPPPAPS